MQGVALNSAARAARVIAVSQTTARDLEEAGIDGERISVISLGVSGRFSPAAPPLSPEAFPGRGASARRVPAFRLPAAGARRTFAGYWTPIARSDASVDAPPLVFAGGASEYGRQTGPPCGRTRARASTCSFPGTPRRSPAPLPLPQRHPFRLCLPLRRFRPSGAGSHGLGHAGGHRERRRHGRSGRRRGPHREPGTHARKSRTPSDSCLPRKSIRASFRERGLRPRQTFLLGTHGARDGSRLPTRRAGERQLRAESTSAPSRRFLPAPQTLSPTLKPFASFPRRY